MAELTTAQAATQSVRQLGNKFSDKLKIAAAKTTGGETKAVDVAIVKATSSQFHVAPKEKHVRTLITASSDSRCRSYIASQLHRRLHSATDWLTALKTLITIHRLMRETSDSFLEELLKLGGDGRDGASTPARGGGGASAGLPGAARALSMRNFIDTDNIEGRFDFSEWVRAYGQYLDTQLDAYAAVRWYVGREAAGSQSRLRSLAPRDLLLQLPPLQRLQRRLVDCVPRGAATRDPVVTASLLVVVKESFQLYKAISEGVINLADSFFDMQYLDAVRGLELYRESMASSEALSAYYAGLEALEEVRASAPLPKLSPPPLDFATSMEAYLAEAPRPMDAAGSAQVKAVGPLRKGRLMQKANSVPRGLTAVGAGDAAPPRGDPGMLLPLASPGADAGAGSNGGSASPPAAPAAAAAPAAPLDLLGAFEDSPTPATEALSPKAAQPESPAAPAAKPSALDLLGGLSFDYAAPATAVPAANGGAPPAASSNPFGPRAGANPFGDSSPVAAPPTYPSQQQQQYHGQYNGAAPPPPAQAPPPQQQFQYQQPQLAAGAWLQASSPAAGGAADPFAQMEPRYPSAAPLSPGSSLACLDALRTSSSNPLRASGSGFPTAAGGGVTPGRASGGQSDLFKAAGAHDPFAALTGLPGKPAASPAKSSPAGSAVSGGGIRSL